MTAKPRHIHGRQQHVVEKSLGVGHANGEGARADSSEYAVAGNNDRRQWIESHDVLLSCLDVANEVAVDEM